MSSILKHLSAHMLTSPTKRDYIEWKHSQKPNPLGSKLYSWEALCISVQCVLANMRGFLT